MSLAARSRGLEWRGGEASPRRLESLPEGEGPALAPFEWLEAELARCREALQELLPAAPVPPERWRMRLDSRASRPGSQVAETALLVEWVVEGRQSLVPLLWQTTARGATGEVASQVETAREELEREARAGRTGAPLEQATRMPVVLAPWLASQLIHECIGHTSEADNFLTYARPAGVEPGYVWTPLALQVFDDPLLEGHRGSYAQDDDGQPAQRTQLIRDGQWAGLLHNADTRARMGVVHGGNGRRTPGADRTLPRMSVTYAAPGEDEVQAMISRIEDGMYCEGTWGGGSAGLKFVIRPAFGRRIREGRLTDLYVRRFDLQGGKLQALAGLSGIGRDLRLFNPVYGCDKDGQNNLPVTLGAPHLALRELELIPLPGR